MMNRGDANRDVSREIITSDLERRPSRAPDYQAEAQALAALAETMSTDPGTVLQRLVEAAMELTRSDSAGISVLEPGGANGNFRWVATAGAWSPYRDGMLPRETSPCSEVIAQESVLLMKNPERLFPALLQAEPGISEGLLAPFRLGGVPVGTVWTVKHRPDDHFEAEDARVLAEGIAAIIGAIDFVTSLRPELPRAIASSSTVAWITTHLDHIGLRDAFGEHVYSGREHVARGKPAPDIYLHAAAAIGVPIERVLIIEDSPVGVTGAVASGARVLGLAAGRHCGPDHEARLRAAGAPVVVHDFESIAAMLA